MTARTSGVVALAGVLGWAGLIWIGVQLYTADPRAAGFDLELLLTAGRAVAAGQSPYDPALVAGLAPAAEGLFYSYPPVVAQLLAAFAPVPSPVMFVTLVVTAVGGLGWVAASLAGRYNPTIPRFSAGLTVIALVPLMFPLAIGLLFGNIDVLFPLAFGLALLAVVPSSRSEGIAAGAATGLATLAKLHPASVVAWLFPRSFARATERAAMRVVLISATAVGVALLAGSVIVGGIEPWIDYAAVVRAGSGADIVDPRNAGPAAQLALLFGGGGASGESLARILQLPVTFTALVVTVAAAIRLPDPVESLAWAVASSLIVLPVTWYHYPSALIPFALVAVYRAVGSRARLTRRLIASAGIISAIAIAWLPLLYLAVGLVLSAVRLSRPEHRPGGNAGWHTAMS